MAMLQSRSEKNPSDGTGWIGRSANTNATNRSTTTSKSILKRTPPKNINRKQLNPKDQVRAETIHEIANALLLSANTNANKRPGEKKKPTPDEKDQINNKINAANALQDRVDRGDLPNDKQIQGILKQNNVKLDDKQAAHILKDTGIQLNQNSTTLIDKYCNERFFAENDWAKKDYTDPFLEAVTAVIKDNDDSIVLYTLKVLTTQSPSTRIRSQLLANINGYIFADNSGNISSRSQIENADRLHMAMYLATITYNRLLPRTDTQKSTFDLIKDYAEFSKFNTTLKALIENKASNCKRSFRKTEDSMFKHRDVNCTVKQWIEIYMLFPVKAVRRACMTIIFENK